MALFGLFNKKQSLQTSGVLEGCTDRHSHILYGVDDGAKTLEDSLSVLEYLESVGIKDLWCTPHIMEDLPNTTEQLQMIFQELQQAYKGSIRLHLAAEYMLDSVFEQRLKSEDLMTMEDDILLVETSTIAEPYDLAGMLQQIMSAGYRPLFAHPERYRFLTEKDFDKLYNMGVKFQLNLGSITGYYGETAKTKAEFILNKGMYSVFGSDCHRLSSIKQQYERESLSKAIVKQLKSIEM